MDGIVLSLFGGVGLLDKGFSEAGFCIVRGPDLLWGSNIKDFDARPLRGKINGVIAGVPCQKFSVCTKKENRKNHEDLWPEFYRIICESDPDWYLAECVYGAEKAAMNMISTPKDYHPSFKRIVFSDLGSAQARPRLIVYWGTDCQAFWRELHKKGIRYGLEWREKIGRGVSGKEYKTIVGDRCTGSGPAFKRVYRTILQNGHTANNKPAYRTITGDRLEQRTRRKDAPQPPRFIKGDDFLDAFDLPKDWTIRNGINEISIRTEAKLITQGVPVSAAYALAMTIKSCV